MLYICYHSQIRTASQVRTNGTADSARRPDHGSCSGFNTVHAATRDDAPDVVNLVFESYELRLNLGYV